MKANKTIWKTNPYPIESYKEEHKIWGYIQLAKLNQPNITRSNFDVPETILDKPVPRAA